MSLRSADEAEDGGNAVTVVHVSLGTHITDPIERLRVIQESMRAAKNRLGHMKKAEINAYTAITSLPLLIGQSLRTAGHSLPIFNVVISNVPGPRETLYCENAELLANYPVSLIWRGYALNITAQSYRDNLEVGIIACRDSVPRVQRMLDYLESALRELE
jgi:diacylglycerol O-acyltransferase